MGIKIDLEKCNGCASCLIVCPNALLSIKDGKACVDEGCQSCGTCRQVCDQQAIILEGGAGGGY